MNSYSSWQALFERNQMLLRDRTIKARLYGALLCLYIVNQMASGAGWIFQDKQTLAGVAKMLGYPTLVAWSWLVLSALLLPYLLTLVFGLWEEYRTQTTRLACWATLGHAYLCGMLAFVSRTAEFDYFTGVMLVNCLLSVGTAAALAWSINASQLLDEDYGKRCVT